MKRNNEPPRLLPHVLQAITDLRESGGCTTRRIVDVVRTNASTAVRPRNITMQVRRAIKHGIERGIIKQRSGKYYANFSDPLKNAMTCRRRGKKRRGGRRRKRAAHPVYREMSEADSVESVTASDSDWEGSRSRSQSAEPADRGRRRRRRGRRGRKRHNIKHQDELHQEESSKKVPPGKKDYSESYGQLEDSERRPECSNPDCLCNLKQEKLKQEPSDGPVKKSRENFRNDYIN